MTILFDGTRRVKPTNRVFGLGAFPATRDNTLPRVGYTADDAAWWTQESNQPNWEQRNDEITAALRQDHLDAQAAQDAAVEAYERNRYWHA